MKKIFLMVLLTINNSIHSIETSNVEKKTFIEDYQDINFQIKIFKLYTKGLLILIDFSKKKNKFLK